ncbi:glycosyltransferase family 87 protein [Nesterenkonia populi]|uniref:glycosyltransferase family 87 protein n=1 Tax=Nesterenkonia populi TaxID=1591087 RepID=UPI0011BD7F9E|nr:glycosyltransferase 87 family protein [Nesterenkonia populi]
MQRPAPISRTDPVVRLLSDRAGGPAGRRMGPRREGFWTLPRVLLALTAVGVLLSALSMQHCRANGWGGVEVYHYGCYSDVAALWSGRDFAESPWAPFLEDLSTFEYPVLTMLLASLAASVTHGLDGLTDGYWEHRTGLLFWDVTFLTAALCWFALVLVTMRAARHRPWDAAIVALSPAIIFGIGINWDIYPALALAGAILLAQRQRWAWAGLLIGVGASFKLYPLFMLGALFTLAVRRQLRKDDAAAAHPEDAPDLASLVRFTAAGAAAWAVLNVPAMLISWESWVRFYEFSSERGAGYSSIWHVWQTLAEQGPDADTVSTLSFLLFLACCAAVFVLGMTAPVPPRMVQLLFLIVAAFCIANKVYSPQFMLWLAPLIVLAAPRMRDVIIWHAVQLLHFWAIWMHLANIIGDAEPQHSFDESLYVIAAAAHMLSTLYICAQVIWDMHRPSRDIVRV